MELKFGLGRNQATQTHRLRYPYFSFGELLSGKIGTNPVNLNLRKKMRFKTLLMALAGAPLLPVSAPLMGAQGAELNVYLHRQTFLIKPFQGV